MNPGELQNKKITIFAHGAGTGNGEELRDWLNLKKTKVLVYITFPFGMAPQKEIITEIYRGGRLVKKNKSMVRFKDPMPVSYLKDFLYALFYCVRYGFGSDVFVGSDNLLTLAGIWMKQLARIKKIVYYMIDYTPVRYANKLLNALYYSFDRTASYRSDAVWPLDPRTIGGRFDDKKLDPKRVNWYPVPYGNHASRIKLPKKVVTDQICYMGGLLKNKGAEMFIPIAEELVRRKKRFHFIIIGAGSYAEELRAEIRKKKLGSRMKVLGYIEDFQKVMKILSGSGVALAPYYPEDRNNFSYYADAGKLKSYVGCGLPIVLTDVPPFAKTLAREGAGLIAKYDPKDIADKIARVISRQRSFRANAIRLGREFDWDLVLTRAFGRLN